MIYLFCPNGDDQPRTVIALHLLSESRCIQVVEPSCADKTAGSLRNICVEEGSVRLEMYEVGHAVTEKEMLDIIEFMLSKCQSGCWLVEDVPQANPRSAFPTIHTPRACLARTQHVRRTAHVYALQLSNN